MDSIRLLFVACFALGSVGANAAWTTSTSKDEMTGKISAYASSNDISPSKPMGFPYATLKAWLGIGCNSESEWAYIGFTSQPNLNNTETNSGYNSIDTRIKWGDSLEGVELNQDWGSKFIHFIDDKRAILGIEKSSSVLLELDWHGNGKTYFKFPLSGSSKALKKIREACK